MAKVFKNPNLRDYFVELGGISKDTPLDAIAPVTDLYEAGKVITLPDLKFDIDFDFWENLPTDEYPALKKISSSSTIDPDVPDAILERSFAKADIPDSIAASIRPQLRRFYAQVVPIYEKLFGDYEFTVRRTTWRLNTIHNEDMHVDTYAQEFTDHFARMFINLDRQPRIWQTSYTIEEMFDRSMAKVPKHLIEAGTDGQVWKALNTATFGPTEVWWDGAPRHVLYFDPGDAWIVDSRQVAHQIFYGRRAVSVDFFVDPKTMKNRGKQYLNITRDFRARAGELELQ